MKSWSLRAKLTAWSAIFAGFFMALCAAGALFVVQQEQFRLLDEQLDTEAHLFFRDMHLRGEGVDWRQPEQVTNILARSDASRYVEVTGVDAQVLYKSPNLGMESLPAGAETPQTVQVAGKRARLHILRDGLLTLRLAASLDEIDAEYSRLSTAFIAGLPILLGFVAFGGWWLARAALAPVRAITAAAQQITATKLSERLPIPDTGGEIGQLGTVLNETFDRLDKSFRQASRFSADASHELKTPLTILRTSIEDLLESETLPELHRDAVADLLEQTTRLASITQSLLLLSRADAGHLKLDLKETDLTELIDACVEDARVMAESRDLAVEAEIPEGLHGVVDSGRLVQALLNLLDNALKYNRRAGSVRLGATRTPEGITITVENTGPGISEDHAAHLFERFYRATSNSDIAGQGLGLSLARELARAHGGDVVLVSSELDKTVFEMRIRLEGAAEALHA